MIPDKYIKIIFLYHIIIKRINFKDSHFLKCIYGVNWNLKKSIDYGRGAIFLLNIQGKLVESV